MDEILYIVEGNYYGHPNRNRGRYDVRQNTYRASVSTSILGTYSPPLGLTGPSLDGVDEYRATTFNSSMRGNVLLQRFVFGNPGDLYRAELTSDGRTLENFTTVQAGFSSLDIVTGPGGVIVGIDHSNDSIKVLKPNDQGAAPMQAYDIFPWRAPATGGQPFVIGGVGFSGTTSVSIGGTTASITSVSPTRVKGVIPTRLNPTSELLDVEVQSAGQSFTIPAGFRYLFPSGQGTGKWASGPSSPIELGEVAAGVINGVIYMVGDGGVATFAYNHFDGSWVGNLAMRPHLGDHHGAEIIGDKLYLIGGLGGVSGKRLQIYTPSTNSWTASVIPTPVDFGSASTAVIDGILYVAGGIDNNVTHGQVMSYDPETATWTARAPMPQGRNHAASGTDGKKFYVFGGRDGPNAVAPGFNDVQIYDPVTNTWEWSGTPGSGIQPLPQARGGTGKAAYFNGEFYVIGGETDLPFSQTYNRVDVFNPTTLTWRAEAPLPTARHGIFPLVYDGKIFVIAGGVQAGHSESDVMEIFSR